MLRSLIVVALVMMTLASAFAEPTPPVMPRIQETPVPPPVELSAPGKMPDDVPNRPLTADEAARVALMHQPNVSVARMAAQAAQARRQQARSGLLPSLAVGGSYTNLSTSGTGGGSGLGFDGYQMNATLRQLLFDFNHTREQARQAGAQARSAEAGLSKVQSDLVLQVKQAFYTYLQNQRLVAVQEANLKNQQNHLASAQARLKEGVGLPVDVVRAQTAVSDAIFSLNLAQNNASVSRVNLALLMGIDPRTPVVAAETGEPPAGSEELDQLLALALKQRPEVAQAQANVEAATRGVAAARTNNSPALAATAGSLQRGTSIPLDSRSMSVGMALSWNLFDGGLTSGKVKEARANLTAAQAQAESARLAVISDTSQSYLNLKTAEQRVTTAEAQVANAQEAVRLAQGRYDSGLGTFLDVLDAQTALVTAQTNLVNARSAVDQARAALSHAIGTDGVTRAMQAAAPRQ